MAFVTRFAPSPTGPLHLGHAYSALLAHDMARAAGGRFLLRIEDIDRSRSREEWVARLMEDLAWLGVRWDGEPLFQSARLPVYQSALDDLWRRGLLYPCTCTRKDVEAALSAPQEGAAPASGADGPIYPGTCRDRTGSDRGFLAAISRPRDAVLRLDMRRAAHEPGVFRDQTGLPDGDPRLVQGYVEEGAGGRLVGFSAEDLIVTAGDIVLARKDMGTSYHLSAVLDDAGQGITHVVRGADLAGATPIHVLLQRLFGLPTPVYHHHRLIRDAEGRRLAKRDDARALGKYRSEGATPADIRRMVGLG